jgi:hypothetical protein
VLGSLPDRAVDVVAEACTVFVLESRAGAVGVICDEGVVAEPLANAPAGMAKAIPVGAIAAANLKDFTGLDNVVERRIPARPGELVRNMHGFSSPAKAPLPSKRECDAEFRRSWIACAAPIRARLQGSQEP